MQKAKHHMLELLFRTIQNKNYNRSFIRLKTATYVTNFPKNKIQLYV